MTCTAAMDCLRWLCLQIASLLVIHTAYNDAIVVVASTSNTATTMASTSTVASSLRHCSNYTVLNDSWRNVDTPRVTSFCDQYTLKAGLWYRFLPPAGHAIPETAPSVFSCGTDAPMWLNGRHPTNESSTPVVRQLCANYNGDPCLWSTYVQVAWCPGGYYVYMAPVTAAPVCSLAWCGVILTSPSSVNASQQPMSTTGDPISSTKLATTVVYSNSGPCNNYSILNDSWRNVDTPRGIVNSFCDQNLLTPGIWYRFMLPAGIAIPETIPPIFSCGTDAPMWLNGRHPTSESSIPVVRQLCANHYGNPCMWSTDVHVTLCSGGYYVYMAPIAAVPVCSLAWCGVNVLTIGNASQPPMSTISEISPVTSMPVPTTRATVTGPCNNYTVLNDSWRNVNASRESTFCDQYLLNPGIWYRLMPPAGNAIPETAPPTFSCGTNAPMWLNGRHPTNASSSPVVRQLCANYFGNPCMWSTDVQVSLCSGGYYVYMAPAIVAPVCSLAWCGENVIMSGDISLQPSTTSVSLTTTSTTKPAWTTGTPIPTVQPAATSPMYNRSSGPCNNYTILNDTWRNVNSPPGLAFCDQDLLRPGIWYRLMPPAGTAIPETAPSTFSCGTNAPMWLNGRHPTNASSSPVLRQLCANYFGNPCMWSTDVQVALCSGGYYVYMAPTVVAPLCTLAWCAENVVISGETNLQLASTTNAYVTTTATTKQTSSMPIPTTQAAITSPTFNRSLGPCNNYTILNDTWRNVNSPQGYTFCDQSLLRPGIWYRLVPPAGTAIPESAPPEFSCGTNAPMWLNGRHPTNESTSPVVRQLCANYFGNPCMWSTDLQVAYCTGGYYVYMAPVSVAPVCSLAWCAVNVVTNSNVSLQPTSTTSAYVPTTQTAKTTWTTSLPSTTSQTGTTTSVPKTVSGPCNNYTVLNESWRNVNAPKGWTYCDRDLLRPDVWYRLMPPAGNAIPETIPPLYGCGADAPMWLNGQHPTNGTGSPVVRQLCANFMANTCAWSTDVHVTLCSGGYYVYMAPVKVVPECSLTWCGVNIQADTSVSPKQTTFATQLQSTVRTATEFTLSTNVTAKATATSTPLSTTRLIVNQTVMTIKTTSPATIKTSTAPTIKISSAATTPSQTTTPMAVTTTKSTTTLKSTTSKQSTTTTSKPITTTVAKTTSTTTLKTTSSSITTPKQTTNATQGYQTTPKTTKTTTKTTKTVTQTTPKATTITTKKP